MAYVLKKLQKLFLYPEVWFLTVAAFLTRFWNLAFPNWVVFDETYFGLFATKYLSHQYYFDIHPPLGKMILGFAAWLGGAGPGFDFAHRSLYPDNAYVFMRMAPAFFGALLVPLIYVVMRQLGFSRRAGFIAAFLVLAENALLVESRFTLLNIVFVFFIFSALALFRRIRKSIPGSRVWCWRMGAAGLALGAAVSVKWIGLGALAMVWVLLVFEQKLFSQNKKRIAAFVVLLGALPALCYAGIFAAHMALLSEDCLQNCGSILGEEHLGSGEEEFRFYNSVPEGSFAERFLHDHARMIGSAGGGFFHENKMPSYQLPFGQSSIVYANETQGGRSAVILLKENFLSWIVGLAGIVGVLYLAARAYAKNKWHLALAQQEYAALRFLLLGYGIFFGLFAVLFHALLLYHYFTALVFSFMMFAAVFEKVLSRVSEKKQKLLLGLFVLLVTGGFVWGMPQTYGFIFSVF